jgi:hypothetical protein
MESDRLPVFFMKKWGRITSTATFALRAGQTAAQITCAKGFTSLKKNYLNTVYPLWLIQDYIVWRQKRT